MADLENIVIKLQLDAAETKQKLTEVQSQVKSFGGEVKHVKEPVEGLKGAFKELGATVGKAFAAVEIVKFLYDSAKAAGDDAQSFAILENQLHNTTGATKEQSEAIDKQLESMSNATGTKMPELRSAYGQLLRATNDSTQAMQLQKVALNLAAAAHVPVETAAKALARAHNGNTGALIKLDPALKNSKDIMKDLAKQTAGAAQAAANANPFQRLQAIFENIKVTLGKALLPIFNVLANTLVALQPIITLLAKLFEAVVKAVLPMVDALMKALMPVLGVILKVVIDLVKTAWKPFQDIFKQLMPTVVILAKTIGDLLVAIEPLLKIIVKLLPLMFGLQIVFISIASKVLPPLIKIFDKVLVPVIAVLSKLIENLFNWFGKLANLLMKMLKPAIDWIAGAFKQLGQFLMPLWTNMLKPMIDGLMKFMGIKSSPTIKPTIDKSGLGDIGDLSGTSSIKLGGVGAGTSSSRSSGSTVHHHKHTHITTKVHAKTDAKPQDIAANVVNAVKFNLPVSMAGGTGVIGGGMGSEVGGMNMAGQN